MNFKNENENGNRKIKNIRVKTLTKNQKRKKPNGKLLRFSQNRLREPLHEQPYFKETLLEKTLYTEI